MSRLEDGEVLNCSQVPNSRPDHLPVVTDQARNRRHVKEKKEKQNSGFTVCSEVRFLLMHLKYTQCYVLSHQITGPKPERQFFSGNRDLSTDKKNRDKHKCNKADKAKRPRNLKDSKVIVKKREKGKGKERRDPERQQEILKKSKEKHLKER